MEQWHPRKHASTFLIGAGVLLAVGIPLNASLVLVITPYQ